MTIYSKNKWLDCLILSFLLLSSFSVVQAQSSRSVYDSLLLDYQNSSDSEERFVNFLDLYSEAVDVGVQPDTLEGWRDEGDRLQQEFPAGRSAIYWYFRKANMADEVGDFELSYAQSLHAMDVALQLEDRRLTAKANYYAAYALSEYDPAAAGPFYRDCIAYSRLEKDSVQLIDCLVDYAGSYDLSPDFSDSSYLELLLEAREIGELLQLGEQRLTNYHHLTQYYIGQGELINADSTLELLQIIADSLAIHDRPVYAAFPLSVRADLLTARHRYEEALIPALRSLEIMLENKLIMNLNYNYEQMISLYRQTGKYREAFDLQTEYMEHLETVFSSEKQLMTSKLNEQYRTAEKEGLIETQQAELKLVNQRYFILGGAALFFGALLMLVFFQSKRIKRTNAELSKMSSEAVVQNDRLNTLLGELHHRVKNNLQLISSLLRLQARKTSDESIKSALSIGQRRVEAMSIIHQRLYQQENLTVVDVQSAFGELIKRTDFTYRAQLIPIEMEVSAEPRHLDATQAVPLTLIVNELVTNSCKYAFGHIAQPVLKLSMVRVGGDLLRFNYSDNGPGMPAGKNVNAGFGTQLINSLSGQLGGESKYWTDPDGAHFELTFKKGF